MLDSKLATDILVAVDERFGSQVAFTQEFKLLTGPASAGVAYK